MQSEGKSTTLPPKSTELQRLRLELLRKILRNEARRKQQFEASGK